MLESRLTPVPSKRAEASADRSPANATQAIRQKAAFMALERLRDLQKLVSQQVRESFYLQMDVDADSSFA